MVASRATISCARAMKARPSHLPLLGARIVAAWWSCARTALRSELRTATSASCQTLDDRRERLHQLVGNQHVRDAKPVASLEQPLAHLLGRTRNRGDRAALRQRLGAQA